MKEVNPVIGFDEERTQARMTFKNGLGISVITGEFAYTAKDFPYEVMGIHTDGTLFDDPEGFCDEEMVTKMMVFLQSK